MVKLIVGRNGMGKTKTLIEECNLASERSNGLVVCLEKGKKLTYDIKHEVRLIDVTEYNVTGFHTLLSFTSGIMAANYDVTDIFIDSALKIGAEKVENMELFMTGIKSLSERFNVNFYITSSCEEDELTADLKAYL